MDSHLMKILKKLLSKFTSDVIRYNAKTFLMVAKTERIQVLSVLSYELFRFHR